jgi:hypothetical protein
MEIKLARVAPQNGWRPIPYAPPPAPYQAVRPKKLGEVTVAPSTTILDSPLLALSTDVVAALAGGYLAWSLGAAGPRGEAPVSPTWSTIWWVVAAAAGIKALHDLSRLNA